MNRIKHNDKNDGTIYVRKGYRNDNQSLNFLGFKTNDSKKAFIKSKIGILSEVLHVIETEFSDYISFSFEEKNMKTVVTKKSEFLWIKDKNIESIYNEINNSKLNIINKINCNTNLLCEYLDLININYSFSDKLDKNKYNIIIIHDKDYYSNNKFMDEHEIYKDYVVSHFTYENSIVDIKKKTDKNGKDKWEGTASIDATFKELIIKKDLLVNKKISILDLNKINFDKNIIFASLDKDRGVHFFEFNKDKLDFYNEDSQKAEEQKLIIDYLYENSKDIVIKYEDNIIAISTDEIYPIVDIKKAYKFFNEDFGEHILFKKSLIVKHMNEIAASFKKDKKELKEKYENLYNIYKNDNTEITYFKFLEEESLKNRDDSVIKSIFLETNKLCYNLYKSKEVMEFLYPELVGIRYFEENGEKHYWVGIFTSENFEAIDKASIIRRVKVLKGKDCFIEIIAPLLEVQFIKWADQTVYPFPIKYLREAIEYMNA